MHAPCSRMALVLLGSWVGACATAPSTPQRPPVIPVDGVPAGCENLGTVIGESQPRGWGAGETTADDLVAQATGEAMQRAAQRGGTHIFLSPVTMQQKDGAPFQATRTGVAFRCGGR